MLKFCTIILFFSWIAISCNTQNKKDNNIQVASNNYPQVNLDFMDGVSIVSDSLIAREKVEIKLDSNNMSYWCLNGENILKNELLPKLEKRQLSYFNETEKYIKIDLGIDKNVKLDEFKKLKDSLRIGNYLRASYLNARKQRLGVRFLLSEKIKQSKYLPIPPPPPPGIEESICLCCEENGKFTTAILNYQPKVFNDYADCMKESKLNDSYTYVHLAEDKYYWEGNELNLSTIADSLQATYKSQEKPNRFFMILKVDSLSKFKSYLNLYAVCRKSYVDQWNDASSKKFNSLYKDLSREDKKTIRRAYPLIFPTFFD